MKSELALELKDLDLRRLSRHVAEHGGRDLNLAGLGRLDVKLTGQMPGGLDSLLEEWAGNGSFEINNARLYELRAITAIVGALRLGQNSGQFRQAAGVFTVGQRKVTFSRLAASSSSLGLQGSGTIGFDGEVDVTLVAALLDDWRGKLKNSGLPIIGAVLGEVAGGVQKLINSASANLLSQFRIRGPIGNPQVSAEPTPLLTESAAKLFGKMLEGGGRLLD